MDIARDAVKGKVVKGKSTRYPQHLVISDQQQPGPWPPRSRKTAVEVMASQTTGRGGNVNPDHEARQVGSAHVLGAVASLGPRNCVTSDPSTSPAVEFSELHQRRTSTTGHLNDPSRISVEGQSGQNQDIISTGLSRTAALRLDHSFAFQAATQTSSPPDFEMTRIVSAQQKRRAAYNLPRTSQSRQGSVSDPTSTPANLEASNHQQETEFWCFRRRSKRRFNHVKLVWVYSLFVTAFICTAGVYSLGRILFLGQTNLKAIALDTPLRCDIGMRVNSLNEANAGANALSGNVKAQASTSESLSNDIWGWKRHKGIVYANSHNDEMQGDRAFVSSWSWQRHLVLSISIPFTDLCTFFGSSGHRSRRMAGTRILSAWIGERQWFGFACRTRRQGFTECQDAQEHLPGSHLGFTGTRK